MQCREQGAEPGELLGHVGSKHRFESAVNRSRRFLPQPGHGGAIGISVGQRHPHRGSARRGDAPHQIEPRPAATGAEIHDAGFPESREGTCQEWRRDRVGREPLHGEAQEVRHGVPHYGRAPRLILDFDELQPR